MIPLRSLPTLVIALAALAAAAWFAEVSSQQGGIYASQASVPVHAHHHAH
ncbi:MAG TPA: hypothetical protein VGH03_09005 [Caulobacteraceae bacterium]|jgi:hypothetical protein